MKVAPHTVATFFDFKQKLRIFSEKKLRDSVLKSLKDGKKVY